MSRERNVFIGLLTVVCLLQFDVIADVTVTICPTKCQCFTVFSDLYIICDNQPGIDPQQLYKEIDSLLISNVNSSLGSLTIQHSPLPHVPRSLCQLTTLTRIDISFNRLVELPNNCFMDFQSLTKLQTDHNNITDLPNGVFDGMSKLTYLDVSANGITTLPNGVFDDMGKLTYLDLSANRITTLQNGVFDDMSKLTDLVLSANRITTLPNGVFDSIGKITNLDLSANRITALPNGVFDSMGKLTDLDLSANRIANLPNGIFDCIGELSKLYLSDNQLDDLANGIFNGIGLHNAPVLDLSGNKITDLSHGVFDGMGSLDTLNFSSNHIGDIAKGVFDGVGVTTLDLSGNKITKISNGVFDGMIKFMYLNLSDNKITELASGVFNGTSFIKLDLSGNKITDCVNGVFDGMGLVITLDLSYNQIVDLANGVFVGMGRMDILDLSGNRIASVGREIFCSNSNVTNQIDTQINHLYLDHNKLTSLEPWWYDVYITTKHMHIGKNPWDCSCDNKWMIGWLNSMTSRIDDLNDVLCYTPPRLQRKTIIHLSEEEFCVDPATEATKRALTISMSSVAGVVIVMLSVGVIVYRLRVKLYTRFKFHPFNRDECLGEDMDYDVFLCCSSEDDEPEGSRILETMEANGYSVCYHYRDFMPGLITANIEASVTRSKRTLCLLTSNFVRRFAYVF